MSILTSPEGLKVPEFVVISSEASAKTQELLRLGRLVFKDPTGSYSKGFGQLEVLVAHRTEPNTSLSVCEESAIETFGTFSRSARYTLLGVATESGDMSVKLDHRKLPEYNFIGDPFVDMIMDYFRSHTETARPLI